MDLRAWSEGCGLDSGGWPLGVVGLTVCMWYGRGMYEMIGCSCMGGTHDQQQPFFLGCRLLAVSRMLSLRPGSMPDIMTGMTRLRKA